MNVKRQRGARVDNPSAALSFPHALFSGTERLVKAGLFKPDLSRQAHHTGGITST
jgi:hypothetical protein